MANITREQYAKSYGPTVGDQVRLGDTNLWIEITEDLTFGGDEAIFGGGKTIRESMLQGLTTSAQGAPDTVITNVIILDVAPARERGSGDAVVRADVGIKDGHVVAIGKAGNSDVMDGVTPGLEIGPCTDVISGEGKILTAGAVDTHVHYISPSAVMEAVATGTTTLIGGGVGPSEGSKATTVTPGPQHLVNLHRSFDDLPVNVMLLGKGNTVGKEGLDEQALAGAGGFKIHEDWGATPAALDAALKAGEEWGVQVTLHADSLNEAGFVETTLDAIGGRGVHVFHAEGAGGGHAPDILKVAAEGNVLPASTNPTLPYTRNTVAEHIDMLASAHHLDLGNRNDQAFADSRIRSTTMFAEDVLHDMGAMSITSSDAQAMGRIGEVVTRTWQVAHVMKEWSHKTFRDANFFYRTERGAGDNARALRYVAKYTINPAIAHGIDEYVGSVAVGKLADLVLWDPRFFAVRPEVVIKGGAMVLGNLGDPNGSVSTPQPTFLRPALAYALASQLSYSFVSDTVLNPPSGTDPYSTVSGQGVFKESLKATLGLRRELRGAKPVKDVTKADMVFNGGQFGIDIDPSTFRIAVEIPGLATTRDHGLTKHRSRAGFWYLDQPHPPENLPLTQRYLMF
ncbi:urease subunit alpha [Streptomyces capillispiralis]|uniref:Urease subunit alpha n=1 Tax=Streptomyces capillispiralis TaxID=68182 RepID=A0A561TQQ4_9ACTN|nr:urease subunit alpha [Streptomyces capillispiralis]TWF89433.1 urease subunit alpha [Streptomyces capillispiralis]GHH93590.1 urease subunit alpha [Streptomyces capillispiralis]